MKRFVTAFAFCFVVCAMMGWPRIGSAENFKLRLQCIYPEKAYVGQNTQFFAERVVRP